MWHALQGSWTKLREKKVSAAQIAMFSSLGTRLTAAERFSLATSVIHFTHKHTKFVGELF